MQPYTAIAVCHPVEHSKAAADLTVLGSVAEEGNPTQLGDHGVPNFVDWSPSLVVVLPVNIAGWLGSVWGSEVTWVTCA